MPVEAYRAIKQNRTEAVMKKITENLESKERQFIKLWFSETARKNLKKAMETF
jgi:hypothetical protein